ncbi:MAG: ABC transporter ATP-binding protein [Bernardetiaceae bacterium]|nr:ABC transporter ATP-binding protein [Bernardetiaceae bacterium]
MINIESVSKSFKSLRAVDNLSLTIPAGQFLALLGPNGAGKTTLVEMVEGLQTPDSGQITLFGLTWARHGSQIRAKLGLSLQETRFVDKLTVRETLELFGSFYGLPRARSQEMLRLVDLEAKASTYTVHLSGGQRQRLALGVAVMHRPELLILDEPTTGLDPNARRDLWQILLDLKRQTGTTLILTTHYMEEAEQLCDRIVIMDQGKILADGTLAQLLAQYAQGEVITYGTGAGPTDGPELAAQLAQLPGYLAHHALSPTDGLSHQGQLLVQDLATALPALLELLKTLQVPLLQIGSRKKTLDDLFVAMTGRNLQG